MDNQPFVAGMIFPIPTLGTIRMGEMAEHRGRQLPRKLDHFHITTEIKTGDDKWQTHPIQEQLLAKKAEEQAGVSPGEEPPKKLTEIPIHFMTNAQDLIIRARYEAIDRQTGRILCAGNGMVARRRNEQGGIEEVECPGSDHCTYGNTQPRRCKFFGRVNVQIDGQSDQDSTFVLRTTSVNTLRTFYSKLAGFSARFGSLLRGIPFKLVLRDKASAMSKGTVFHYVDLALNNVTAAEAIKMAHTLDREERDAGLDQEAFEKSLQAGLAAGSFDPDEDGFTQTADLYMDDFEPAGDDEQIGPDLAGSVSSTSIAQPGSMTMPSAKEYARSMKSGQVGMHDSLIRVPPGKVSLEAARS